MARKTFPNDVAGRAAAEAEPAVDGKKEISITSSAITVYVGDDVVIPDPRPTVSKWQLIQSCADAGITEAQIDTAVALLTNKRQRFWKYTQAIDRDNPFSSNLRTNLVPVPTPAAWNAIFLAAASLDFAQV